MTTSLAGLGIDAQLAAARDVLARRAGQPHRVVEPLGLARRQHEQRCRQRGADAQEGFEDGRLFALQGARGNDHRAARADPEVAEHARPPSLVRRRARSAPARTTSSMSIHHDDLQTF